MSQPAAAVQAAPLVSAGAGPAQELLQVSSFSRPSAGGAGGGGHTVLPLMPTGACVCDPSLQLVWAELCFAGRSMENTSICPAWDNGRMWYSLWEAQETAGEQAWGQDVLQVQGQVGSSSCQGSVPERWTSDK